MEKIEFEKKLIDFFIENYDSFFSDYFNKNLRYSLSRRALLQNRKNESISIEDEISQTKELFTSGDFYKEDSLKNIFLIELMGIKKKLYHRLKDGYFLLVDDNEVVNNSDENKKIIKMSGANYVEINIDNFFENKTFLEKELFHKVFKMINLSNKDDKQQDFEIERFFINSLIIFGSDRYFELVLKDNYMPLLNINKEEEEKLRSFYGNLKKIANNKSNNFYWKNITLDSEVEERLSNVAYKFEILNQYFNFINEDKLITGKIIQLDKDYPVLKTNLINYIGNNYVPSFEKRIVTKLLSKIKDELKIILDSNFDNIPMREKMKLSTFCAAYRRKDDSHLFINIFDKIKADIIKDENIILENYMDAIKSKNESEIKKWEDVLNRTYKRINNLMGAKVSNVLQKKKAETIFFLKDSQSDVKRYFNYEQSYMSNELNELFANSMFGNGGVFIDQFVDCASNIEGLNVKLINVSEEGRRATWKCNISITTDLDLSEDNEKVVSLFFKKLYDNSQEAIERNQSIELIKLTLRETLLDIKMKVAKELDGGQTSIARKKI